jgi:hypothetical protein
MNKELPPSIPRKSTYTIIANSLSCGLIFGGLTSYSLWPEENIKFKKHLEVLVYSIKDYIRDEETEILGTYLDYLEMLSIKQAILDHFTVVAISTISSICLTGILTIKLLEKKVTDKRINGGKVTNLIPNKMRLKYLFNAKKNIIKIHPSIWFDAYELSGNLFAFGSQGSGKTTFIRYLLDQLVISSVDLILIFDEKREYTQFYYDEESTLLFAPWDQRGSIWDIGIDLTTSCHFRLFANQVIIENEKDPSWTNGARDILIALLISCKKTKGISWINLSYMLKKDTQAWKKLFTKFYPQALPYISGSDATSMSFISSMTSSVNWIHTIANFEKINNKKFSLKQFFKNQKSSKTKLIIQSHPEQKPLFDAICSALISFSTSIILSREDNKGLPIWFFIDEFGNLPQIKAIEPLMSTGRSKKLRVVAGTQSISQLYDTYKKDKADTILNLFTNHVVFKCSAIGRTSEVASNSLGEAGFERLTQSVSNNRVQNNWNYFKKKLVTSSDIVNIKMDKNGVKGYLKICTSADIFYLTWPFSTAKPFIQSFVELKKNKIPSLRHANKFGRMKRESK